MERRSYTRTGDNGTTGRFGGKRLSKAASFLDVLGALDEANAALGAARAFLRARESAQKRKRTNTKLGLGVHQREVRPLSRSDLNRWLRELQDVLFRVGADLSTPLTHPNPPVPRITDSDTKALEAKIDALDAELPDLRVFILPGGTPVASLLHLTRAIIRRAERSCVRTRQGGEPLNDAIAPYLNRLSSYLFALARYANLLSGYDEEHPRYTRSAE